MQRRTPDRWAAWRNSTEGTLSPHHLGRQDVARTSEALGCSFLVTSCLSQQPLSWPLTVHITVVCVGVLFVKKLLQCALFCVSLLLSVCELRPYCIVVDHPFSLRSVCCVNMHIYGSMCWPVDPFCHGGHLDDVQVFIVRNSASGNTSVFVLGSMGLHEGRESAEQWNIWVTAGMRVLLNEILPVSLKLPGVSTWTLASSVWVPSSPISSVHLAFPVLFTLAMPVGLHCCDVGILSWPFILGFEGLGYGHLFYAYHGLWNLHCF